MISDRYINLLTTEQKLIYFFIKNHIKIKYISVIGNIYMRITINSFLEISFYFNNGRIILLTNRKDRIDKMVCVSQLIYYRFCIFMPDFLGLYIKILKEFF